MASLGIRAINGTWYEEASPVDHWRFSRQKHTLCIMLIALSVIAIVAAWVLLLLRVDPVPTWFYVFAWYPTLVLFDAVGTHLDGRPSMLWRRPMIYVFLWSPVVWFCFEIANFRLENWYYVSLPHLPWERWCGIVLSFATVVPAVLLAERLLDAAGLFQRGRGPVLTMRSWELNCAIAAGLAMGALSLVYPRLFFPLIWGAVFLVVDPLIFRAKRSLSLLGDLSKGYWGRLGRLMLGGALIGLLWESHNYWARGKWIYTVPWLEELKLFEMPPFGFVGFPVFTLEAWSMYAGLCLLGVAAPLEGTAVLKRGRMMLGMLLALALSAATLVGMERLTISSTVPRLSDLPGVNPSNQLAFKNANINSTFDLATADPNELTVEETMPIHEATALVQTAQLATTRGIGSRHVARLVELGIENVCELSRQDPGTLFSRIVRAKSAARPNEAEVRVWVRAARRTCPLD
jgi:hypothetical protein